MTTLLDHELAEVSDGPAEELLTWAIDRYGDRFAIVTALQVEGLVLLDLASRIAPDVRVITVDTGRLPQETYELIDQVRGRYGVDIEVVFPSARDIEAMTRRHGVNLFRRDPVLRRLCCEIRKVIPLDGALRGLDAWATGLRRGQSEARAGTPKIVVDPKRPGVVKLSPIADWTTERMWAYVHEQRAPIHPLYERGYRSIGCEPCTRSVAPGADERAGRWWWEDGSKECGIHERAPDERLAHELAAVRGPA